MFGTKAEKAERLEQIIELLELHGSLSQAELAQRLRVPQRSNQSSRARCEHRARVETCLTTRNGSSASRVAPDVRIGRGLKL